MATKYDIEFKPRAEKDLMRLADSDQVRIINALETLAVDLRGDIKKLTAFSPEYLFSRVPTSYREIQSPF